MPASLPSSADKALRRLATVWRGRAEESWHFGALAVVAPNGSPLAAVGDPSLEIVLRSTAKPFQALPLLAAGGVDAFALEPADLALICSSHSGTAQQRSRARSLLERGGFSERDLLCGGHRPLDEETAKAEESASATWTPLYNNCSGKHAGMLLACRLLGYDAADYIDPEHPLQRAIATRLGEILGRGAAVSPCGIDGCSAPTFALSLAELACAFAQLGAAGGELPNAGATGAALAGLGELRAAMSAHPEMVAGPRRFTSALIAATAGRLVGKEGAEGVYAVAIRAPEPLGIALKIADGSERCRDVVVLELLARLGLLAPAERATLAAFDHPKVDNHRGTWVGEIRADFELG